MGKLGKIVGGTILGSLGMAAYNAWADVQAGPIRYDLPGEGRFFRWREQQIFYQVAGDGPALLLIHSINAGASLYEMRYAFTGLAQDYRVFAIDLLGFGLSDRPARSYTPELYIDLLSDFIREVIQAPVAVIATSLASTYIISLAAREIDRITRLILIAPTGIEALTKSPGIPGIALQALLFTPVLGTFLYNVLVSRPGLIFFLQTQAYFDASLITDPLLDNYYATTHMPGARYAPAGFISGGLNHDIENVYRELTQPTLIVWGQQAITTPVSQARVFIDANENATLRVFDRARLLPHEEHPEAFIALVKEFLAPVKSGEIVQN
ncbi:MAG: alpha/beta fold hydrolase [Chloroflexi bacterium]|nr:alpha/beta fold hydrolase [Chloroflexota bacterium]